MQLLRRGILSDDYREIQPGNYNLVYVGELSEIRGSTQNEKLEALFEKFNWEKNDRFREKVREKVPKSLVKSMPV